MLRSQTVNTHTRFSSTREVCAGDCSGVGASRGRRCANISSTRKRDSPNHVRLGHPSWIRSKSRSRSGSWKIIVPTVRSCSCAYRSWAIPAGSAFSKSLCIPCGLRWLATRQSSAMKPSLGNKSNSTGESLSTSTRAKRINSMALPPFWAIRACAS